MKTADTPHSACRAGGSERTHPALPCPAHDLPAHAFLCQPGPGTAAFLAWLGWKQGQEEATLRPALWGCWTEGEIPRGRTLCLSPVPECPPGSCSGKLWLAGGCLHRQHRARRDGARPVSATKEKKQTQSLIFFNPSAILSCHFAEVGALAAMASMKCRYAPGVLCSTHAARSLRVGETPVGSHVDKLPRSMPARPGRGILGFGSQAPQKHVSPRPLGFPSPVFSMAPTSVEREAG